MGLPVLNEQKVCFHIFRVEDLPFHIDLLRLLEIFCDHAACPAEIERLIMYDNTLPVGILRVANSAYYELRGKVSAIPKAISIIGLAQVRSICLLDFLMNLLLKNNTFHAFEREALWKHAYATARAASLLALWRPWIELE